MFVWCTHASGVTNGLEHLTMRLRNRWYAKGEEEKKKSRKKEKIYLILDLLSERYRSFLVRIIEKTVRTRLCDIRIEKERSFINILIKTRDFKNMSWNMQDMESRPRICHSLHLSFAVKRLNKYRSCVHLVCQRLSSEDVLHYERWIYFGTLWSK